MMRRQLHCTETAFGRGSLTARGVALERERYILTRSRTAYVGEGRTVRAVGAYGSAYARFV